MRHLHCFTIKAKTIFISCHTVPKLDASIMTSEDMLFYGLCYIGFGEEQQRVVMKTSADQFKAHYGPEPWSVKDLMSDLCNEFPDTKFKEPLLGLNWLKLSDIESVLSGHWNYDESVCSDTCCVPIELSPLEKD